MNGMKRYIEEIVNVEIDVKLREKVSVVVVW
jgi:hypothetical protein